MNGQLSPWTREQYDADESRVRSTRMKDLVSPQGPRAYFLKHLQPQTERTPDANDDYSPKVTPLVLGSLFHELVIDGKVGWFATSLRRGTTTWKVACRRHVNLVAVTQGVDEMLWAWKDALDRNAEVKRMLALPYYGEQIILWDEEVTFTDAEGDEHTVMVPSKCAIDFLFHNAQFACLKTTRATDPNEEWNRELEKHNYIFSAAFYHRGIRAIPDYRDVDHNEPMCHIVLCKSPPYYAYPRPLDREWMKIGSDQVDAAYKRYATCMHNQHVLGMDPLVAWPDLLERTQLDPATPSMRAMERHGKLATEVV